MSRTIEDILKDAHHHLQEHASEYGHPGQPALIAEIAEKLEEIKAKGTVIRHPTVPKITPAILKQLAEEHSYSFVGILDEVASYGEAVLLFARQEDFAITPHTLGGFRGGFIALNRRAPNEQEIWDGGVRAGISLAPQYPLK